MNQATSELASLLLAIEAEMRRIGLWEREPPPDAALASLAPFCYDTLAFHQWLQWVFLPSAKRVVETDSGWPTTSDIFPLAEHSFRDYEVETGMLLVLLRQFDNFINRQSL